MASVPGGSGGASYGGGTPLQDVVTFATGLGAINHILGPSDQDLTIVPSTADASDARRVFIGGGGAAAVSRGGFVELAGNEATNPGELRFSSGTPSTVPSPLRFLLGGTERILLSEVSTVHRTTFSSVVRIDTAEDEPSLRIEPQDDFQALAIVMGGSLTADAIGIANAGTGTGLSIVATGDSVGASLDNTASSTSTLLDLINDGTGIGLLITASEAGSNSLRVDHSSSSAVVACEIQSDADASTLLIDKNGAGAGEVLRVENAGTGNHIGTDAGAGTPAHLTNTGTWTNASCYKKYKRDFEDVDGEELLDGLMKMDVKRWRVRRRYDPSRPKTLHVFQDDLVRHWGLSGIGINPGEVASALIPVIQTLTKKVSSLKEEIEALKGAAA